MARKKSTAKNEDPMFEIQFGFIKRWDYFNSSSSDQMNGHPLVGRVYRLIKEPSGYRLHIGRENNSIGIDGLFLGQSLNAERTDFAFDIEVVTPQNYLEYPLSSEDADKIIEWSSTENKDLWDHLKKEETGQATSAIGKLADLAKLIHDRGRPVPKGLDYGSIDRDAIKERAAQTAMELLLQFKKKSPQDLLVLFDGMYERLVKIQEGE